MEEKKIANNVDLTRNPVSTILGGALVITSTIMFATPMFIEVKQTLNYWIPGVIGTVGLLLILSPDTLLGIIKKGVDKRIGE